MQAPAQAEPRYGASGRRDSEAAQQVGPEPAGTAAAGAPGATAREQAGGPPPAAQAGASGGNALPQPAPPPTGAAAAAPVAAEAVAAAAGQEPAARPGKLRQLFDYLLVVDIEATCDQEKKLSPQVRWRPLSAAPSCSSLLCCT